MRSEQDEPILIDDIDSPYASIPSLREMIYRRGLPEPAAAGGGGLAVVGSMTLVASDEAVHRDYKPVVAR